jgi:magnesium transporter
MTWKRGMWLVILFFTALFTAFALSTYQEELSRPELAWVVLFIPLVISCGGNSGGQSAALIITALTMGDVKLHDWFKVVQRELLMGLFLGSFLGMLGFVIALVFTHSAAKAIVIPFTLLLVVTAGTLTGSLLPLVFRRLGLDPALMSTPFVTGIIDIVGIIVYMNVALMLL